VTAAATGAPWHAGRCKRLRDLLGDSADPGIVLDMQVWRMTVEARKEIAAEVAHLRQILGRDKART